MVALVHGSRRQADTHGRSTIVIIVTVFNSQRAEAHGQSTIITVTIMMMILWPDDDDDDTSAGRKVGFLGDPLFSSFVKKAWSKEITTQGDYTACAAVNRL
jgi:hypothetical protein